MAESSDLEDPAVLLERIDERSVKFLRRSDSQSRPLCLNDLFNKAYSGLDNLIELNLSGRGRRISQQEKVDIIDRWCNSPDLPRDFVMQAEAEGEKLEFQIEFRSHQLTDTRKYPNTMYIKRDGKNVLIVRQPRFYAKSITENVANSLGITASNALFRTEEPPELLPSIVPESILVDCLEEFYTEGYPRVTIPFLELHSCGQIYYFRSWLSEPFRDLSPNQELVARHLALLHSLNLVTQHDRRSDHYFSFNQNGSTNLVNIDPDFVVYYPERVRRSPEASELFAKDESDFISNLASIQENIGPRSLKKYREAKRDYMKKFGNLGRELFNMLKERL